MQANYRTSLAHPNNPFIEALPKRLSDEELVEQLVSYPEINEDILEKSADVRIAFANKAREAFLPLHYAPSLYSQIYQGLQSSYTNRQTMQFLKKRLLAVNNSMLTQAASFSVLGVPGIGKSATIARIFNLIPQLIEHESYKGEILFCKQINYLHVQCPYDCSVNGCCIEIFKELDMVLEGEGADYAQAMKGRGYSKNQMVSKLSQLCQTHHIGMIVIDEIQNITNKSGSKVIKKNSEELISFLVQLMNGTGVSIVLVGTPEVKVIFDRLPHLQQRSRGTRLMALEYGQEFQALVQFLWSIQYTRTYEPLTDEMMRLLYEISGGIPRILSLLLSWAQEKAIASGADRLSKEIVMETVLEYDLQRPPSLKSRRPQKTVKIAFDDTTNLNPFPPIMIEKEHKGKGRPRARRDDDDILLIDRDADIRQVFKRRGWLLEVGEC